VDGLHQVKSGNGPIHGTRDGLGRGLFSSGLWLHPQITLDLDELFAELGQ